MNSFKVNTAFSLMWWFYWLTKTLALALRSPTCCEAAAAITRRRITASFSVTDNHFLCKKASPLDTVPWQIWDPSCFCCPVHSLVPANNLLRSFLSQQEASTCKTIIIIITIKITNTCGTCAHISLSNFLVLPRGLQKVSMKYPKLTVWWDCYTIERLKANFPFFHFFTFTILCNMKNREHPACSEAFSDWCLYFKKKI